MRSPLTPRPRRVVLWTRLSRLRIVAGGRVQVGHILGLGHPDLASVELSPQCTPDACGPAGQDVQLSAAAAARRMDNESCLHSFAEVVARPEGEPVRPAMMISFTQHNPTVCLSDDDLEALNALYPECTQALSTPVCFKTKHNVRLRSHRLAPPRPVRASEHAAARDMASLCRRLRCCPVCSEVLEAV